MTPPRIGVTETITDDSTGANPRYEMWVIKSAAGAIPSSQARQAYFGRHDEHAQLNWDDVEPLATVFANPMQRYDSMGSCGPRYRPPSRCAADMPEAIRGSCGT